jgi:histone acetyltransferase (RNA polymerase elongator complex component)
MKCVHLDFHTSPLIESIGRDFEREEYIRTIREAHIDLMTVFAKCHHGYCYYPTKVGEMHPHLSFDLLGAQLEAIRERYEEYFIDEGRSPRLPRFGGPTRGSMPRGAVGAAEQFSQAWGFGPRR